MTSIENHLQNFIHINYFPFLNKTRKDMSRLVTKKVKLNDFDPELFHPLYFPHDHGSVNGLMREHLRMYFALLKLRQPGLYKINYQIYLKYVDHTNQKNPISEEREINIICSAIRAKISESRTPQPPQEPEIGKVKSLSTLAKNAVFQLEGWHIDRLVGDSDPERWCNEKVINMKLNLRPKPTVAKQRMIVHGIETFCTSFWLNKNTIQLDHPKELPFRMEVDVKAQKVTGGRWFETEFLRSVVLPHKIQVKKTGDQKLKIVINQMNFIEIDLNKVD